MAARVAAAPFLRGALYFVVVSTVLTLGSLPSTEALSDAQILLELANATGITLGGWNASNVDNLCFNWDLVDCDQWGRVSRLKLIPEPKTIPIMRGKMPDSILGLTNLTSFQIPYNAVSGDFPAGMFQLPVLRDISISSTGLTVRLPSYVSPSLQAIYLDDTRLVTPLADHYNWSTVDVLDLRYSGFKCPLPQSFVDYHLRGNIFGNCRMQGNFLEIVDNKLCGQLPLEAVGCNIFPMAYAAPFFPTDNTSVNAQFRTMFAGHFLEFIGREVYISAAYQNRGVYRPYRGEYIAMQAQPIAELTNLPHQAEKFHNRNVSTWSSFITDSPTRVRANLTAIDNLVVEYIFEQRISAETNLPYLKFALIVHNLGYEWIKDRMNATNDLDVSVSLCMNYRIQHSLPDGPYVDCTTPPAPTLLANCSGPIGSFKVEYSFASFSAVTSSRTNKTQLSYEYGLVGSLDNVPLDGDNTGVFLARIPYPLPSALWLEKARLAGGSLSLPTMPESNQSVAIPIEISTKRFQRALYYDPDISITLLFDPSDADPSASPQQLADIQVGITVGAIIAIVVVIVVVAVGVTVGAVVVFPYWKSRQASNIPTDVELEGKNRETQGSWKTARTPSKD
eukprot:TRINITY_DN2858_c0_g1_i4.p1 TRINITY_DN2858_c0_g1~~TRINITY_DN2858_c0_g1_i4.p1  ORF type:complete len:620 (-),score=49.46 TRINITY_DN2858_c0_g1_i4:210-2069(-)